MILDVGTFVTTAWRKNLQNRIGHLLANMRSWILYGRPLPDSSSTESGCNCITERKLNDQSYWTIKLFLKISTFNVLHTFWESIIFFCVFLFSHFLGILSYPYKPFSTIFLSEKNPPFTSPNPPPSQSFLPNSQSFALHTCTLSVSCLSCACVTSHAITC